MIIPILDSGELVLERQYRYPVGQVMIEFPAGKLNAGEDTLLCAKRELLEETGYTATHWAWAGVCHPVISYSTEFIEIWFAKGLSAGKQSLDEGEFVEVINASNQQFSEWCRSGVITDAKTLSGALFLQNVLSGTWTLDWVS
jgi:ADP-ribose pyrophosphatase